MTFQPGNKLAKGGRRDKLMRDAIVLALKEETTDQNGLQTTKARLLGCKLVAKGLEGDVAAIREINDRVDGKVPQAIVGDDEQDPVNVLHRIERIVTDARQADPKDTDSSGIPPAVGAGPV